MVLIRRRYFVGGAMLEQINDHAPNSEIGSLFPQHPRLEVDYHPFQGEGEGGVGFYVGLLYEGTISYYRTLTALEEDVSGSFVGWICRRCFQIHHRFTDWSSNDPEHMLFLMDICLSDDVENHYPADVAAPRILALTRALAEEGRIEQRMVLARPCTIGCGAPHHWYLMYRRIVDQQSNFIEQECSSDAINLPLLLAGFDAHQPADGDDGDGDGVGNVLGDGGHGAAQGEINGHRSIWLGPVSALALAVVLAFGVRVLSSRWRN